VTPGKGRSRARPSPAKASDVRVRYLSCGDTAFSVEFANEVSPDINGRVIALHAAIGQAQAAGQLSGLVETVPTMRSLMVTYDPLVTTRATLEPAIKAMVEHGPVTESVGRDVTIPCCYDDPDFAPDLQDVAKRTGKSVEQAIACELYPRQAGELDHRKREAILHKMQQLEQIPFRRTVS
jgi:hypothetical protein